MKYRFITALHNLELENVKNKGTRIFDGARISNGEDVLSEILDTEVARETMGQISINEFKGTSYLYVDGEYDNFSHEEDFDREGGRLVFYYLRCAQHFASILWEVKDSNVYVRDGFLFINSPNIKNGILYKASLSAIFTKADGSYEPSRFSDKEIESAVKNYTPWPQDESDYEELKKPNSEHFYKNSDSTRMSRASYFTIAARNNPTLPMKLVSYCTALECLFTTGTSEVNHKIAERVAVMLGTSKEEKKELFKLVKKAYGHRSTVVHGSNLKGSEDNLFELSIGLDEIMRKLIIAEHEVFSKKDNEIDDFFADLLFTNSSDL